MGAVYGRRKGKDWLTKEPVNRHAFGCSAAPTIANLHRFAFCMLLCTHPNALMTFMDPVAAPSTSIRHLNQAPCRVTAPFHPTTQVTGTIPVTSCPLPPLSPTAGIHPQTEPLPTRTLGFRWWGWGGKGSLPSPPLFPSQWAQLTGGHIRLRQPQKSPEAHNPEKVKRNQRSQGFRKFSLGICRPTTYSATIGD